MPGESLFDLARIREARRRNQAVKNSRREKRGERGKERERERKKILNHLRGKRICKQNQVFEFEAKGNFPSSLKQQKIFANINQIRIFTNFRRYFLSSGESDITGRRSPPGGALQQPRVASVVQQRLIFHSDWVNTSNL